MAPLILIFTVVLPTLAHLCGETHGNPDGGSTTHLRSLTFAHSGIPLRSLTFAHIRPLALEGSHSP